MVVAVGADAVEVLERAVRTRSALASSAVFRSRLSAAACAAESAITLEHLIVVVLRLTGEERLRGGLERLDRPGIGLLAIVAACCLPVPPAAVLLAVAARAKLRATAEVPGRGLATFSAWVASVILAAPLVTLIIW